MSYIYRTHYVYWLFDETMTDPLTQGYIGISYDMKRRLHEHRKSRRHPGFQHKILHEFENREEALKVERSYRPRKGIGWNFASGGVGPSVEWIMPPEALAKRKNYLYEKYNLDGQIFGTLKVLERGPDKARKTNPTKMNKITTQICQCLKCGEIIPPVQTVHLRSGHTKGHRCVPVKKIKKEQVLFTYQNKIKSLKQWAAEYGIAYPTLHRRIKRQKLTFEEALHRPNRVKAKRKPVHVS